MSLAHASGFLIGYLWFMERLPVMGAVLFPPLFFHSPGPLPDTLSPEELGTGRSEIRNRTLATIFKDLKLIEAWGTGISKMRSSIEDYSGIELILNEPGYAFQVQFRKKTSQKKGKSMPKTDQAPIKHRPSSEQAPTKVRRPFPI